jgi:hypothetical protein
LRDDYIKLKSNLWRKKDTELNGIRPEDEYEKTKAKMTKLNINKSTAKTTWRKGLILWEEQRKLIMSRGRKFQDIERFNLSQRPHAAFNASSSSMAL